MNIKFRFAAVIVGAFAFMTACSGGGDGDGGNDTVPVKETIDVNNIKIKGQNFMMPSPLQIADMIKKSNAGYNKSMLNPTDRVSKYTESMKQALNLGIYGADLGYITMYNNNQDAIEYYKTVNTLADQLKITASFDPTLMKRFNDNIGNKDSILALVGEAYRRSDNFLRESDQDHLAGLILAGGWIESMYFALNTYKTSPNADIKERIGEQKKTSSGLVKLLSDCNKPEFGDLIQLMTQLDSVYQQVQIKYTFAEPTNDEGAKLTTIQGTTEVSMSDELLAALTEKITAVRNYIIN